MSLHARRNFFRQRQGKRDDNATAIVKAMRQLGRKVYEIHASTPPGISDAVAWHGAIGPTWLELKTPKGKLSESQLAFKALVESYGQRWACAKSLEEALEATR